LNIVIPKIIKYPIDSILSSMWYHCLNSEDLSTSAIQKYSISFRQYNSHWLFVLLWNNTHKILCVFVYRIHSEMINGHEWVIHDHWSFYCVYGIQRHKYFMCIISKQANNQWLLYWRKLIEYFCIADVERSSEFKQWYHIELNNLDTLLKQ
jgi:hypothetical protein